MVNTKEFIPLYASRRANVQVFLKRAKVAGSEQNSCRLPIGILG
jgi:hypothetical protein